MPTKRTPKPAGTRRVLRGERDCEIPACGRAAYARGVCQTHYRQLRTTGEIGRIRPYQPRAYETEKFSGLRLSPECIEQIERKAEDEGLSNGAAITDILEDWAREGARRSPR